MDDAWWWLLCLLVLAMMLRWLVVRRPSSRYGCSPYGGPGVVGRRAAVGNDDDQRIGRDADVDLGDDRDVESAGRDLSHLRR